MHPESAPQPVSCRYASGRQTGGGCTPNRRTTANCRIGQRMVSDTPSWKASGKSVCYRPEALVLPPATLSDHDGGLLRGGVVRVPLNLAAEKTLHSLSTVPVARPSEWHPASPMLCRPGRKGRCTDLLQWEIKVASAQAPCSEASDAGDAAFPKHEQRSHARVLQRRSNGRDNYRHCRGACDDAQVFGTQLPQVV
jgi:hypothetical protein